MERIFKEMVERWPSPVVARREVDRFTGGAISSKSMANLDSSREGCPGRFRIGRMVVYPAAELANWLQARSTKA